MNKYGVKLSTLALAGLSIFAVSSANALEKDTGASAMSANVGGMVQLDSSFHMTNDKDALTINNFKNGTEVRRAKLNVYGDAGNWSYKLGVKKDSNVVAGNNAGESKWNISMDDVYATYHGLADNVSVSFGWMCPIFGQENSSSSAHASFLEASALDQVYGTSTQKGLQLKGHTDSFAAGVSVFFPEKRDVTLDTGKSSEMLWGLSGRFTFSPAHEAGRAYHIGASGFYQNHNAQVTVTNEGESINALDFAMGVNNFGTRGFKAQGLTFPNGSDTDKFNVDSVMYGGLDAAAVMNSFSGKAEVVYSVIKNKNINVTDAKAEDKWLAFNAEAAYVLTGESRDYDFNSGTIGGLTPMNEYGAFEVAGRLTYLDMTGDNVKENADTLFVNSGNNVAANVDKKDTWLQMWNIGVSGTWYANEYASVKANFNIQRLPEGMSQSIYEEKDKNLMGFGVRAQLSW